MRRVSVFFALICLGAAVPATANPDQVASRAKTLAEQQQAFLKLALSGRVVFVGVEKIRVKGRSTVGLSNQKMLLRTTHYAYATDTTLVTTIDPNRNAVLTAVASNGAIAAFAKEEIDEAKLLARADPELRRLLKDRLDRAEIDGLGLRPVGAKNPSLGHRVVVLLFREGGSYLVGLRVAVDLTSKTVKVTRPAKPHPHKRLP